MNALEIEEVVSKLAEASFDPEEFSFSLLEAFGNKPTLAQVNPNPRFYILHLKNPVYYGEEGKLQQNIGLMISITSFKDRNDNLIASKK